jgi:hypothetical protein
MGVERLREIVGNSAIEVERLCGLFYSLQELIQAECESPLIAEASLSTVIAEAMDRVLSSFAAQGVSLRSSMPDKCPILLIDNSRTIEALCNILVTIQSLSRRGDVVEIVVATDLTDGNQVTIQNLSSNISHMKAETRVGVSVADAVLRNQRASLSWSLRPLTAQINFQAAPAPNQIK